MSSKKRYVLYLLVCMLSLASSVYSKEEAELEREIVASTQDQCPPWFLYNSTLKDCQCFQEDNPLNNVMCTEDGALLAFGWCMTYDEESGGTFLGLCPSFMVSSRNVSKRLFITLPSNVSELNDYMCRPLNRKGLICSECIDGFAPSAVSYTHLTLPTIYSV